VVKTATGLPVAVAVVKIGITEDPGCGNGYEQISVTATACTPLVELEFEPSYKLHVQARLI
jgi:hypothetical protein